MLLYNIEANLDVSAIVIFSVFYLISWCVKSSSMLLPLDVSLSTTVILDLLVS